MERFYLIVAGGGGTLIICQFIAGLLGLVGDSDVDHDHDTDGHDHADDHAGAGNWFLGMLTFRSVAAAITFFGLGGLTARYYQATEVSSFVVALLAAYGALYLVAMLMRTMTRLKADGSVRMERALGQTGRVYLTIPPRKSGTGKVTLAVQNRTVECQAITAENELTTGTAVTVIALHGPNLVEVMAQPA
jgi:membrane protein implicated in regulation of membrane protease activity